MRLESLAALVGLAACGGAAPLDYSCADIAPQKLEQIWSVTFKAAGCSASGCHDPGSRQVTDGFTWQTEHDFWQKARSLQPREDSSKPYVTGGDLSRSYLYDKLTGPGQGSHVDQMPVGGPFFTSHQLALVKGWICSGAPEPPSNLQERPR